jgi:peptidoglycan-associated lipoprotein
LISFVVVRSIKKNDKGSKMKLKKWINLLVISSSIIALSACSTHKRQDDSAINDANAAYASDGAQASGVDDDASFGDRDGSARTLASNRIYYFDFDSSSVRDQDMPAIASNASYLTAHPNAKVLLEGHTDPRGSREYNVGLGERRAKAVAEVLTEKGVSPSQIRILSYGSEKLAIVGHSDADYAQDRRVVLVRLQK